MTLEADIRAPEIHNDPFAKLLTEYARRRDLRTFLDIGASDGRGSTSAFVEGLKDRPAEDHVQLYALELRENRFKLLVERFKGIPYVNPIWRSSVPSDKFPTEEDIRDFWKAFGGIPEANVLNDLVELKENREHTRDSERDGEGIEFIKHYAGVRYFDFVLIDGNHWTGEQELYRVIGAKVIALDDVRSYKCFNAARMLNAHSLYQCVHHDPKLRFGYAIFERK